MVIFSLITFYVVIINAVGPRREVSTFSEPVLYWELRGNFCTSSWWCGCRYWCYAILSVCTAPRCNFVHFLQETYGIICNEICFYVFNMHDEVIDLELFFLSYNHSNYLLPILTMTAWLVCKLLQQLL